MNLLRSLQERFSLTYVFIVHDLAVAEYFCDRLAVLYLGGVMELADREAIFNEPLHPYTVALLSAVPIPDPARERRRERIVLSGEVSPSDVVGCRFRPRCPVGRDRDVCRAERPPLRRAEAGPLGGVPLPRRAVGGEREGRAAGGLIRHLSPVSGRTSLASAGSGGRGAWHPRRACS